MSAGLAKLVIAITVALLGGAAAWFGYPRQPVPNPVPPAAVATPSDAPKSASLAPPSGEPGPATDAASGPTFDVVRVEPNGDSVIAGRAAPGATIDLLRNGEPLARMVADATGLFAIVPPALAPGSHEITLRAIGPDGARSRSAQGVTVVVAARRSEPPLVTVTAPDQPTVVLSRPDAPAGSPTSPSTAVSGAASSVIAASGTPALPDAPRPQVKIATVETQGDGRLMVSGLGAPGATLRLYLNDAFVAPGATAKDGKLAFSIERGIRAGDYRVRLDDVDPVTGQVRSRVEVPFTVPAPAVASTPNLPGSPRPPERPGDAAGRGAAVVASAGQAAALPASEGRVVVPEVNTAIVVRGETLWRISKRVYGQGLRYTVIYGANTPQIRNPDLIYPGQLFVLPAEPQGKTR